MISFTINGKSKVLKVNQYPNGEQNLLLTQADVENIQAASRINVTWQYKDDSEFLTTVFLLSKMRDLNPLAIMTLTVPYLPYARMDRIEKNTQFFTLSYFLNQMVTLGVDELRTMDVHSFKARELLGNRVRFVNMSMMNFLCEAVQSKFANEQLVAVFLDETARLRFASFVREMPSVTIQKQRDFETGKLVGFQLSNPDNLDLTGKVLVMVDDLCSYGGAFLGGYQAIKESGFNPKGFALLVTHLETAVFDGKLLSSPDLLGLWFSPTFDWNAQDSWKNKHKHLDKLHLIKG